jgi:hypothetical protein
MRQNCVCHADKAYGFHEFRDGVLQVEVICLLAYRSDDVRFRLQQIECAF